jgi:multidrug efflux pump
LIAKVAADAEAIIWLAVSSKNHSLMEISEYAEQYIKDRLEILPGVANIITVGERKPAMRISLNPYRLAAYSLTVKEIADALRHQNIAMPSGRLESNSKEFVVYSKTDLETENEFKNIIL